MFITDIEDVSKKLVNYLIPTFHSSSVSILNPIEPNLIKDFLNFWVVESNNYFQICVNKDSNPTTIKLNKLTILNAMNFLMYSHYLFIDELTKYLSVEELNRLNFNHNTNNIHIRKIISTEKIKAKNYSTVYYLQKNNVKFNSYSVKMKLYSQLKFKYLKLQYRQEE